MSQARKRSAPLPEQEKDHKAAKEKEKDVKENRAAKENRIYSGTTPLIHQCILAVDCGPIV